MNSGIIAELNTVFAELTDLIEELKTTFDELGHYNKIHRHFIALDFCSRLYAQFTILKYQLSLLYVYLYPKCVI